MIPVVGVINDMRYSLRIKQRAFRMNTRKNLNQRVLNL